MKNNSISNLVSKVLIGSVILIAGSHSVSASEVTGTISTGLGNNSVSGVVIQAPVASPVAGTYTSAQAVTLSSPSSLSIYYTTNGTTPVCGVSTLYTGAITVSSSFTISAIACYTNNATSSVRAHAYVISAPVAISSGGGGGGGGYSAYVPAVQAQLPATTTSVVTTTTTKPVGVVLGDSASIFVKDLKLGMRGQDVTELQKILIAEGFLKTDATGYFGALTKEALVLWQRKYNVVADGVFAKTSRDLLITTTPKPAASAANQETPKRFVFNGDLSLGARGQDVTELQKILVAEKLLNTTVFGRFGPATKAAVIKWQIKNKLPATGYFGPSSRAVMNKAN